MKIIGENKDDVIVQMTKDEAAKLNGFHSAYSAEPGQSVRPGLSFSIDKLYENANDTLTAYKELKEMFQKAQRVINTLLGFMKAEKE